MRPRVDAPFELGPLHVDPGTSTTTEPPSTTSEEAASTMASEAGEAPGPDPALVAVGAL